MDKKYYLFDLDGTLTDSKVGITKSARYALESFGIEVGGLDELEKFIGPPLLESFETYYGFSKKDARIAAEKFRERFTDVGIYENMLYSGVDGMLGGIVGKGKTVLLATSKPIVFAERILEHFDIRKYFTFVAGGELDESRAKKSEVIRYALDGMKIANVRECVMIGDRLHDIIGAKETGMESVGVLYGYGNREELENAGADYIAETVDALCNLLE